MDEVKDRNDLHLFGVLAKTWPVTRMEEHRSRGFDIEVLLAVSGQSTEGK